MCFGFFVLSLDIYRTAVFSPVIYYKYFINRQIVWNSISLFAPVTKSTKFFQKEGDINMTKKTERRMLQRPLSPRNTCGQWAVCPAAQALSRPCPGHAPLGTMAWPENSIKMQMEARPGEHQPLPALRLKRLPFRGFFSNCKCPPFVPPVLRNSSSSSQKPTSFLKCKEPISSTGRNRRGMFTQHHRGHPGKVHPLLWTLCEAREPISLFVSAFCWWW